MLHDDILVIAAHCSARVYVIVHEYFDKRMFRGTETKLLLLLGNHFISYNGNLFLSLTYLLTYLLTYCMEQSPS